MLFSSDDVAKFINDSFEPVWESVRPVPIVRIDFGNGEVITRTLHGNIATYVCNSEGRVLDILPGIYQPQGYVDALQQLLLLHRWAGWRGGAMLEAKLKEYHQRQADALKAKRDPDQFVSRLDETKYSIESSIKLIAAGAKEEKGRTMPVAAPKVKPPSDRTAADIANWPILAEDTAINETVRRQQIHEKLAAAGAVKPGDIVKWLYKDVLHADLDDRYLGLGKTLFADYPFAAEESRSR